MARAEQADSEPDIWADSSVEEEDHNVCWLGVCKASASKNSRGRWILSPHVIADVNKAKVKAYVDTGASVTLLAYTVVQVSNDRDPGPGPGPG